MKRIVSFVTVSLLILFFSVTSFAAKQAKDDVNDFNKDGAVNILDRLEWERAKAAKLDIPWMTEMPPEIPTPTDGVVRGQYPRSIEYQMLPTLMVKNSEATPIRGLAGVVSTTPLVMPKLQVKFLVRALNWVEKNRLSTSKNFKAALDKELQNLKNYSETMDSNISIPQSLIEQAKTVALNLVYEGTAERMFPDSFSDDVQRVFKNIEELVAWNKISFATSANLNKAQQMLAGESVRGRVVVERNRLFKAAYNPTDTYFNPALRDFFTTVRDAWAWDNARFPSAWDQTRGDNNIVTAILDTGFDLGHPEFGRRMWRNPGDVWNGVDDDANGFVDDFQGWDFVSGGGWHATGTWEDYNGHGTIMAGLIGADSDNGIGISAGSMLGKFMNLVVLNYRGYGETVNIDAGFAYAIAMGADIINLSFSGSVWSPSIETFAQLAESLGIMVVGAAGNDQGEEARFYAPVNVKEITSAGSSTASMATSDFSNIGFGVDFMTPGGGNPIAPLSFASPSIFAPEFSIPVPMSQTVYSPPYWYSFLSLTDPLYWRVAGTSISAAFTSSAANLVKALRPGLTGEQIRQALRIAALQRSSESGIVGEKGYGDLDVNGALFLDPMLEVKITSPGFFSQKFQDNVVIDGYVRNPGGINIDQVELSYRSVGTSTSIPITTLGVVHTVNYNWDITTLPDGEYYLELRARTSSLSPWSLDTMLVRKGPIWYQDVSDPTLPQVATYSVEAVDVDNDGDKDLAVANIGNAFYGLTPMDNNLFINDGSGHLVDESFRFRNQIEEFTLRFIPADLNNDGFIDFVEIDIAITTPNDTFIWMNEGAANPGYFNRTPLVSGMTFSEGGAIGDVDGDGDLDIFLATAWGMQDRLLINNGSGLFSEPVGMIPIESTFHAGAVMADFDSDGDLDIVTGAWIPPQPTYTSELQIYINDGSGRFSNETPTWFSRDVYSWLDMEAADLDNDGDIDVISHNDFYVLNEGGSFRRVPFNNQFQLNRELLRTFEIGDVDRDGKLDLVILDDVHSIALKNLGLDPITHEIDWEDETFAWLPSYRNIEVGVNDYDFADMDSDGDLDLIQGANGNFFTEGLRQFKLIKGVPGDVDGDGVVTILDTLMVAQYAAGFGTWTAAQMANGDVDGRPGITITDALIIARIAAHLVSSGIATVQGEYCAFCAGNPAF